MSGEELGKILVRNNIVHASAIEDPEGFDGGFTEECLFRAAQDINDAIWQSSSMTTIHKCCKIIAERRFRNKE